MLTLILHFAYTFRQKAQHKKHPIKTIEQAESRSILVHTNGKFYGVLTV